MYLLVFLYVIQCVVPLCVRQVYAWGSGSCLGCGQTGVAAEFTALRPRLIEDLQNIRIVDISCGDSHCLALSHGEFIILSTLLIYRQFVEYWYLDVCILILIVVFKCF